MYSNRRPNGGHYLGIAAMILGGLSLIISFIPCIGLIALIPSIIALVLGIVGLVQANEAQAPKGLIAGSIIVSIFAGSIAIFWGVKMNNFVTKDRNFNFVKEIEKEFENKEIPNDSTMNALEKKMDELKKVSKDSTLQQHSTRPDKKGQ